MNESTIVKDAIVCSREDHHDFCEGGADETDLKMECNSSVFFI